jgi:hypothetical protein
MLLLQQHAVSESCSVRLRTARIDLASASNARRPEGSYRRGCGGPGPAPWCRTTAVGQGDSVIDAIGEKDEGGAGWEGMAAALTQLKGRARVLAPVLWRIEACAHLRGEGGAVSRRCRCRCRRRRQRDGGGHRQQPLLEAEPVMEMLWHSFRSLCLSPSLSWCLRGIHRRRRRQRLRPTWRAPRSPLQSPTGVHTSMSSCSCKIQIGRGWRARLAMVAIEGGRPAMAPWTPTPSPPQAPPHPPPASPLPTPRGLMA